MKKVKVITRHAIVNYGSILQAYATVCFFNSIGYNAEIIDYISKKETVIGRIGVFSRNYTKSFIKRLIYKFVKLPDEVIKDAYFRKYRKKLLKLTCRFNSLDELQRYDWGQDILCVGSDQVWGLMPDKKMDPAYFLEFGTSENKYIAYSASMGRTDFDEEYLNNLKSMLAKFSFITVREKSAEEFIKTNTIYDAKTILDPTFMVERKVWQDFANIKINKQKYLLVYRLRKNKELDRYAKEYAKTHGLTILFVSTSIYDIAAYGKKSLIKSPEYVLSLFKNAECVVTDSFHATVFSIIFNKRFVDFLPPVTSKRITDLLERLNIEERIFGGESDYERMDKEIDYLQVNAYFDKEREAYKNYVVEQLKNLE